MPDNPGNQTLLNEQVSLTTSWLSTDLTKGTDWVCTSATPLSSSDSTSPTRVTSALHPDSD